MGNKVYIDRIVEATGLDEEGASRALVAVLQGFLDTVGEKSHANLNITSGPDCDNPTNTNVTIVFNIVVPPGPQPR